MDIFGLKKRRVRNQLDDRFQQKKTAKYIRNIERLKGWMIDDNTKGVELIKSYLESEGMPPPSTPEDCDILIRALNVE